jgi:hypothetical protein
MIYSSDIIYVMMMMFFTGRSHFSKQVNGGNFNVCENHVISNPHIKLKNIMWIFRQTTKSD